MANIPCYRCGHLLDVSPGSGKTPDVCPNCGQNFATRSPSFSSKGTSDDEAKSELSTRNVSAIALLIALIAGVVKPAADRATEVGNSLGNGIILIAVAFLLAVVASIICLAFGKKFRRTLNRSYSLIVIILACFLLAGAAAKRITGREEDKNQQQKQAATEMVKDLAAFEKAVKTSAETGQPIQLDLAPSGNPATEAEKIQTISRMNLQAVAELQNGYLKALNATGYDTLLDPDRAAKDKGFKETPEILAKSKAVVAEYGAKFNEHLRTFPEKVKSTIGNPSSDPSWFRGFEEGFRSNTKNGARIRELEAAMIEKVGESIEVLAAAEGKWEAQDGQFMFENDADMEKFNAALKEVTDFGAEQEKIREEAFSKGKSGLEKLAK
ncbi:MAG: hypothetical protein ACKO2G_14510 [Verrucomicrobiales bacterium]